MADTIRTIAYGVPALALPSAEGLAAHARSSQSQDLVSMPREGERKYAHQSDALSSWGMARQVRTARPRAPKQRGPRTTLRVPEELARIAERRGKDEGLSRNDVLVRFALIGAEQTERMDVLRERAERRLAAWRSRSRTKAVSGFLTPSEFEAAMRLWRQA